ncbi:MAG: transporter [Candidatus Brocadiaceae bacterium]|nr:transporter [Candidatus Brocadiaceae bacterium]
MIQKKFYRFIFILFLSSIFKWSMPAYAHHGGVSTAFGPGSPVETASPMTLGKGRFLLYEKLEFVSFEQKERADPENIETFSFFNTLVGYGITDYLSLYLTLPYVIKEQDSLGTSKGLGDLGFLVQYGFKYGERNGIRGFYQNGPEDTIGERHTSDDLKMAFFGGFTAQTGDMANEDNKGNRFDMGMQPGFAAPTFMAGFSASKMLFPHVTVTGDTSFTTFTRHDDGKPGNEIRFNLAGGYEIFEGQSGLFRRLDIIAESNLLHLTKDEDEHHNAEDDSGGTILYLSPGFRMSLGKRTSIGGLIKFPVWTDLNREFEQQGSEGLEHYRAILTLTVSF